MNERKLLEIIENDELIKLGEFLHKGGDYNQKINGKTLIEHAFVNKSHLCINALLLYGTNLTSFKSRPDWMKMVEEVDPSFFDMIKELESGGEHRDSNRIQTILNETCRLTVGSYPQTYRNVLSFHRNFHTYYSMLACGIHWFEWFQWDYLTKHLKSVFQCEEVHMAKSGGRKLAMLVTVRDLNQMGEEIPGVSLRITGFLFFKEFPARDFDEELKKAEKNDELIIGVRFSDTPGLVPNESKDEVDVGVEFFDSMKKTIARGNNPIFYSSSYTFNNLLGWDHQLNSWATAFKGEHGYFPNILLASSGTYSRIDLVVNARGKDQLVNPNGQTAPEEEFVSMGGFKGYGYELDFCIDEQLGIDTVKLIYDSDPDGGLPIPEEEKTLKHKAG